jgi:hypothetical protein
MSKEIFTHIYHSHHWGGVESVSGLGSDMAQATFLIPELEHLLKRYHITSMLDIPCGDFNWMRNVKFSGDYIGADIVEELIDSNRKNYASDKRRFEVLDITTDALPKVDLIFTRDCLVHLCIDEIFAALENIKASGSTYLLATNYFWQSKPFNDEIETGDWRRIALHHKPFNLGFPQDIVIEGSLIDNHLDKSLGLWKISDITLTGRKK